MRERDHNNQPLGNIDTQEIVAIKDYNTNISLGILMIFHCVWSEYNGCEHRDENEDIDRHRPVCARASSSSKVVGILDTLLSYNYGQIFL